MNHASLQFLFQIYCTRTNCVLWNSEKNHSKHALSVTLLDHANIACHQPHVGHFKENSLYLRIINLKSDWFRDFWRTDITSTYVIICCIRKLFYTTLILYMTSKKKKTWFYIIPDFLRKKIQLLDIGSTTTSIFGGPTEFLLDLICRHSL